MHCRIILVRIEQAVYERLIIYLYGTVRNLYEMIYDSMYRTYVRTNALQILIFDGFDEYIAQKRHEFSFLPSAVIQEF